MGPDAHALVLGSFALCLHILLGFVAKYLLDRGSVRNSRPFCFRSSNLSAGSDLELAQIAHLRGCVCRSFVSLRVIRSALVTAFTLSN